MPETAVVDIAGETLHLLPERAVYWPRRAALIVADIHFGKAAAFRAGGIPVPGGTTDDNLDRLGAALDATGATRLICLGDLLHARPGRVPAMETAVAAWRAARPDLIWRLIRGNHDRHAGEPPSDWLIEALGDEWRDPPFLFRHLPGELADNYTLAGHVHPAVRLAGPGGLSETLPAFLFGATGALLPAFGAFTGTAVVRPRRGDRVFVIADDAVIPIGP